MVKPRTPQPRINQVTLTGCRSLANRTANALRHIDALRQTGMTVRNSVTLGASVALADLDLSTLEGGRIALQRLGAMARELQYTEHQWRPRLLARGLYASRVLVKAAPIRPLAAAPSSCGYS